MTIICPKNMIWIEAWLNLFPAIQLSAHRKMIISELWMLYVNVLLLSKDNPPRKRPIHGADLSSTCMIWKPRFLVPWGLLLCSPSSMKFLWYDCLRNPYLRSRVATSTVIFCSVRQQQSWTSRVTHPSIRTCHKQSQKFITKHLYANINRITLLKCK